MLLRRAGLSATAGPSCTFYPRDTILARVIAIATCPSVCLSVRASVCHASVLCQNEERRRHFFTVW